MDDMQQALTRAGLVVMDALNRAGSHRLRPVVSALRRVIDAARTERLDPAELEWAGEVVSEALAELAALAREELPVLVPEEAPE